MNEKLQKFADLLQTQQMERIIKDYPLNNGRDPIEFWKQDYTVKVIEGKKYIKVDVGHGGKFMIDLDGNIYGIKAYGVIHKGHHYGTLDTINNYYWGDYAPLLIKKVI